VPTDEIVVLNTRIHRPVSGQLCWNARLPCTPYLYKPVEQRGRSLEQGFRMRMDLDDPGGPFDGSRFINDWRR